MAFEHVASGTGTDQELLDLNRAMQARIMANGQEYRDESCKWVKLPPLEVLQAEEVRLQSRIDAAASTTGSASNLIDFRRRA
jgi:hypothetical protein